MPILNCTEGHAYISSDVGDPSCPICCQKRHEDLLWAAGFFDGEGCISLVKRRARHNELTVRITMANVEIAPITLYLKLFGGYTYLDDRKPPQQPIHFWHLAAAADVTAFLAEMVPYLRVKREQAEIALAFRLRRGGPGKPPLDREQDEADFLKLKALKRGVRAA